MSDDNLNILLVQYQECYNNIRHRDALMWQIPAATALLNGTLFTAAATIADSWVSLLISFIQFFGTFVLTMHVFKSDFFRWSSYRNVEKIEKELIKFGEYEIPRGTEEVKKRAATYEGKSPPPKYWKQLLKLGKATAWLKGYMCLLVILSFIAVILRIITLTIE